MPKYFIGGENQATIERLCAGDFKLRWTSQVYGKFVRKVTKEDLDQTDSNRKITSAALSQLNLRSK